MADWTDVPPHETGNAFKRPHGPRCTATVPPGLCFDLTPLPRCKLNDGLHGEPHGGQHSASWSPAGLGKVIFRWRTKKSAARPEIELPTPTADHLHPERGWKI